MFISGFSNETIRKQCMLNVLLSNLVQTILSLLLPCSERGGSIHAGVVMGWNAFHEFKLNTPALYHASNGETALQTRTQKLCTAARKHTEYNEHVNLYICYNTINRIIR